MESFGHKKHTEKRAESLDRTGKQCVPRASGDDCHAWTSRFHPRLQLLDASKRLELVARSTRSVRMRDGVFQILLKFFVGALDQHVRVMSRPNKRREIGQRQAGYQLLPSRPDQRLLFVTRKSSKRLSRKIRRNHSIEFSLERNQRQRMPLPEANGSVGAAIEDDVENDMRVAVEQRRHDPIA